MSRQESKPGLLNISLKKELVRKIIHASIALVPSLARFNLLFTVLLLSGGILFYMVTEFARVNGHPLSAISSLTLLAARPMEKGIIWGPVTLAMGALGALIFYPRPAFSAGIYALAFGDAIASLTGKFWARKNVVLPTGKTLAGSLACFLAVLASSVCVLNRMIPALAAAAVATLLEALPFKDGDNLIIPLGTGMVLTFLF